jgi:thiamine pyrophosphate-dependent acetolactate synthase large subunit-like protein
VLQMANFDREEQLRQLHEKRKQTTKKKVEEAIKRLTKASKAINFNSVAEEAGVSKATLYNHSELKELINFLRNQQEKAFVDSRIKRDENNQNAVIASLKRRIEKLEIKNKELEKENKRLREKENEKLTDYFIKI